MLKSWKYYRAESDIIATLWYSHKFPQLYIASEPCETKWQLIVKVLSPKFLWHKTVTNHYIIYIKNVLVIMIMLIAYL